MDLINLLSGAGIAYFLSQAYKLYKFKTISVIETPYEEKKLLQKIKQFDNRHKKLKTKDGFIQGTDIRDKQHLEGLLQKSQNRTEEQKLKAIQDRIAKIRLERNEIQDQEVFSHAHFYGNTCLVILFKRVGCDIMYMDHKQFTIK